MDKKKEEASKVMMSRKVKRKAVKKAKRKLIRQEMAVKLREQSEDPDFLLSLRLIEQDEAERSLRARAAFEESERAWLEAMDLKAKTILQHEKSDCEDLVEEDGPPEIIWQGNEIILRKKKIRVSKSTPPCELVDASDRPISNPFPPDHPGASSSPRTAPAPVLMEQLPNFGTELDKAHCPFHLKTGACRFGQRCSRVHFHPDKSCTLLIRNMYNGPGLAWDQDEGLEHTDEEVERSYEEFYDDVHTEFLKFGEIVNFKVCRNGSSHLRGNVYVHFKSLDSAVLAYQSINARYFAGKQVSCEFVSVSRWKVAICGEYMKTRFKTCSRGSACNFIHCFCNPGGDYEWANNDKPPPRHWVTKMIALFGYSDEDSAREGHTPHDSWDQRNSSRKISTSDMDRHRSKRSRSMETDYTDGSNSDRRKENEDYVRKRRDHHRHTSNDKVNSHTHNDEDRMYLKESSRAKKRTRHPDTLESFGDGREICKNDYHNHKRRSSQWNCENFRNDFQDHNHRSSKYQKKTEILASDYSRSSREWLDREHCGVERSSRRKSSRCYEKVDKSENCGRERNTDEVSDLSDTELANKYSHKYISKEDSPDENLESRKCEESNYSRKNDERYSVNSPDSRYNAGMEEVIEHDRWEPEPCSFEKHGNC